MGFGFVRGCLALHLADGAIEHLGVELEADRFDVSALLAAQQVAGAPQFEIKSRDLEARAQVGKFFQRGQATARDGSQLDLSRQQEIRVGPAIRSCRRDRATGKARRAPGGRRG